MERNIDTRREQPVELGIASAVTQGNIGVIPEKEVTMHLSISDE